MSDATIAALLEELREVEPLLWETITYLDQGNRVIKFAYQVLDDFALDHLQGCIQRAIAEKEWSYQQILYQNPTIYEAYLIGHRETIRRANTPAAAILAAYIEAKRASK